MIKDVRRQIEMMIESQDDWQMTKVWVRTPNPNVLSLENAVLEWCQKQIYEIGAKCNLIENQYPKEEWISS